MLARSEIPPGNKTVSRNNNVFSTFAENNIKVELSLGMFGQGCNVTEYRHMLEENTSAQMYVHKCHMVSGKVYHISVKLQKYLSF